MKIEDIQHINVNKIVKIVGKDVLAYALRNCSEQEKEYKIHDTLLKNPIEFLNYIQT